MFATLSYNAEKEKSMQVESSREIGNNGFLFHSACSNCRAKKLRCTGQRPTCERCKQKKKECTYPPSERRKRNRASQDVSNNGTGKPSSTQSSNSTNTTRPEAASATATSDIQLENTFTLDPSALTGPNTTLPSAATASTSTTAGSSSAISGTQYGDSSVEISGNLGFDHDEMLLPAGTSLSEILDSLPLYPRSLMDVGDKDLGGLTPFGDFDLVNTPSSSDQMAVDSLNNSEPSSSSGSGMFSISPASLDFDMRSSRSPSLYSSNTDTISQLDNLLSSSISTTQACSNASQSAICRCLEGASMCLEQWEIRRHENGLRWIDSLLALQKRTTSQCNVVLDCKRCSAQSSSMMLPLLMCEQVVNSFQSISDGDVSMFRRPQQGQLNLGSNLPTIPQLTASRGFFGEYEIESTQEWRHVVWVLVMHQLKQLYGLLSRIRSRASSAGWSTKLTKAVYLEDRLRDLMSHRRQANTDT